MSELYAETKTHMGQALHKLHDCENNTAAMACNFQVPMTKTARSIEQTSNDTAPARTN